MSTIALFAVIAAGCGGLLAGYFLRVLYALGKQGSIELRIKERMAAARREADEIESSAEKRAADILQQVRVDAKQKEEDMRKAQERLAGRETLLDARRAEVETQAKELLDKERTLDEQVEAARALSERQTRELERVSKLSAPDARTELLERVRREYAEDLEVRTMKLERENQDALDRKAKDILATVIQRYGNAMPSDVFTSTVVVPNEEAKGKIIGKEGRNIKTFERMTGVDVIVDDTPGTVVVSSHDPIRRQIARIALEALVADGRIQPARVEQYVEKATKEVTQTMRQKGEEAAYECGVFGLDPKLLAVLGRLYYRTSYGQNVLQHSVEMSHIAGMLAEELGANVKVAKTGALLHDIGKAVDHEVQGSHVEIGRRILQKFDVSEDVIKAMQAHHEEYPYETVESIIVQVADAISGARPGARRDSVEGYLKRLADLEAIALRQPGVEKAYALQAGRELRIFVQPDQIDDSAARDLARAVVKAVESELKYPGEIKVAVVRETRVIEFAR